MYTIYTCTVKIWVSLKGFTIKSTELQVESPEKFYYSSVKYIVRECNLQPISLPCWETGHNFVPLTVHSKNTGAECVYLYSQGIQSLFCELHRPSSRHLI